MLCSRKVDNHWYNLWNGYTRSLAYDFFLNVIHRYKTCISTWCIYHTVSMAVQQQCMIAGNGWRNFHYCVCNIRIITGVAIDEVEKERSLNTESDNIKIYRWHTYELKHIRFTFNCLWNEINMKYLYRRSLNIYFNLFAGVSWPLYLCYSCQDVLQSVYFIFPATCWSRSNLDNVFQVFPVFYVNDECLLTAMKHNGGDYKYTNSSMFIKNGTKSAYCTRVHKLFAFSGFLY